MRVGHFAVLSNYLVNVVPDVVVVQLGGGRGGAGGRDGDRGGGLGQGVVGGDLADTRNIERSWLGKYGHTKLLT